MVHDNGEEVWIHDLAYDGNFAPSLVIVDHNYDMGGELIYSLK